MREERMGEPDFADATGFRIYGSVSLRIVQEVRRQGAFYDPFGGTSTEPVHQTSGTPKTRRKTSHTGPYRVTPDAAVRQY